MKTAIYIEDGRTQLVLTPENDWEKSVVSAIELGSQNVSIQRGSFYECRGGWVRESSGQESLIIRTGMNAKDEHGISTVRVA